MLSHNHCGETNITIVASRASDARQPRRPLERCAFVACRRRRLEKHQRHQPQVVPRTDRRVDRQARSPGNARSVESSDQAARNRLSFPRNPAVGGRPVRLNRQIASSSAIAGCVRLRPRISRIGLERVDRPACRHADEQCEHADRHQAVRGQIEQHRARVPPTGTTSPTARPTSM